MPFQSNIRNILALSALSSTLVHAAPAAQPMAADLNTRSEGSIYITNKCPSTVYYWLAGPGYQNGPYGLSAGGRIQTSIPTTYEEGYAAKFNFDGNVQDVFQFEYSQDDTSVWYDFSSQNGNPFKAYGAAIFPNNGDYGKDSACVNVVCPPGDDSTCAYQGTDPTGPVKHCLLSSTLWVDLCEQ